MTILESILTTFVSFFEAADAAAQIELSLKSNYYCQIQLA
jgi:hypothetical protein